jgi:DNA polymerase-1
MKQLKNDNGLQVTGYGFEQETRNLQQETRNSKRIFLVDGNSYLYRAFYATPYLSNSRGIPTNATYAFISMLKKLLKEEKPDSMVVVFDSKAPSFREEISKAYKAQRPPMPGNLSTQIPYVKMVIEAMGITITEKEGFEADDVIGTFVEMLKGYDVEVYIVTSDKDMMQLVTDKVFMFDTMKNLLIGEKEVGEKLGVKPSLVIDYLALCGDTSDNIPGVSGIGEKTARELVSSLGTIDEIYNNLEGVKKVSIREKLVENKDFAFMSKQLATIRLDVPIDNGIDCLKMKEQDLKALRRIFRELEFYSLYKEIHIGDQKSKTYQEVELSQLHKKSIGVIANYHGKNLTDIELESFAVFDGQGIFFSQDEEALFEVMSHAEDIIVHNLKPLLILLFKKTKDSNHFSPSKCFDTMLAAYLMNPLRKDYGIGAIIEEYLDVELVSHDVRHTLTESVLHLFELKEAFLNRMKDLDLSDLFVHTEMPLIEVLGEMECGGVKVDRKILAALSRDFDKRLNSIIKDIYTLAGGPFNINSPQQLSRILFETLKLPTVKKTKTGYSTDTEVLQTLVSLHPLPKEILEYRTLTKLKSTYIDVLPTLINPRTGRIHASFNQMVVATGRLSSSDPNLQNIPIRGEEGMKIRGAFIPEEGCMLLSSDYSQIELRVLAHISGDQLLIDTFLKGEDIHTRVAQEVFKVEANEVTQEMRRTAKVINFGIIYGMSGYGFSKELDISQKDAQTYIDYYFERHRGVKAYMDRVLEEARIKGFVKTLFGRIRYIPEVNNPDNTIRQLGERTAMNTPIQGTAADIIKMAMVNIHRKIHEKHLSSKLIMQIHDELVFEVREEEMVSMESIVREEMEHVVNLSVPLKVTLGKGKSWALAHD